MLQITDSGLPLLGQPLFFANPAQSRLAGAKK